MKSPKSRRIRPNKELNGTVEQGNSWLCGKSHLIRKGKQMREPIKSMVDSFSPYTVAVSRFIVGMLTLLALYAGIRYPIPWLWQHLWKIVSLPLIVIWLVALVAGWCKLTPIIYPGILALVSLTGNALLYPAIFITHLPALYSLIRPSLAAPLLLRLPTAKSIAVLTKIEKKKALNVLHSIEMQSEEEFISLLRDMPRQQLEELMYLENFTRRQRIVNKLGIEMDLSKGKKPYASHGNHS